MNVVETLMEARDVLSEPEAWVKQKLYTSGHAQHCAVGAVLHAEKLCTRYERDTPVVTEALVLLAEAAVQAGAVPSPYRGTYDSAWQTIARYNNRKDVTFEDIREMFDTAIRLAKEQAV